MGNVLLEAMSSALPCIVSHLPGVTDLMIRNDENGLLVPIAQPQALANRLDVLIRNHETCWRLGESARQRVIQQHSFDSWQSELVQLYELMLNKISPIERRTNV